MALSSIKGLLRGKIRDKTAHLHNHSHVDDEDKATSALRKQTTKPVDKLANIKNAQASFEE